MCSLQILHGLTAALCCSVKRILVGNVARNQAGSIAIGWNKRRASDLFFFLEKEISK